MNANNDIMLAPLEISFLIGVILKEVKDLKK